MQNTSGASSGDWITIDSIKVEFSPAAAVPIPASLLPFGPGLSGLAAIRRRFKKQALFTNHRGQGQKWPCRSVLAALTITISTAVSSEDV
jgi:hypothetical protein